MAKNAEPSERNVEAFLATMKLMEESLAPEIDRAYTRHRANECCGDRKKTLGEIMACPGSRADGLYFTPLRFAIPMLGRARYRPAVALLSRVMVESADCECRRAAAQALDRIVNDGDERSPLDVWMGR